MAAHELFHQFFPFYMGSDERRYPILDEGWATALEYLYVLDAMGEDDAREVYVASRSGQMTAPVPGADIPAITPADALRSPIAGTYNAYGKASMAYLALRDLLGEEAFSGALQAFIARWGGKHALPWDMFNTFDDVTGEELDWFWHNWFYEGNYVDLAIDEVGEGQVRIANPGGFAVPFDVVVEYIDGASEILHETPAIWRDEPDVAVVDLAEGMEPVSVTIDNGIYADVAPTDNTWPNPPKA